MIPTVTGASETISESFGKYPRNIPEKHDIKELRKTVILSIAHILREDLMSKYRTFNMGNNITYTINGNYRAAAALCTLETWFVSGM
jgi:hypothetical protein